MKFHYKLKTHVNIHVHNTNVNTYIPIRYRVDRTDLEHNSVSTTR